MKFNWRDVFRLVPLELGELPAFPLSWRSDATIEQKKIDFTDIGGQLNAATIVQKQSEILYVDRHEYAGAGKTEKEVKDQIEAKLNEEAINFLYEVANNKAKMWATPIRSSLEEVKNELERLLEAGRGKCEGNVYFLDVFSLGTVISFINSEHLVALVEEDHTIFNDPREGGYYGWSSVGLAVLSDKHFEIGHVFKGHE